MTYEEIQQILEGCPSGTKVRFSGTYGEMKVTNEEAIVEVMNKVVNKNVYNSLLFHQNVWDNCFMENKYGKKEVYSVTGDHAAKNITSLEVVEENQAHHGFKIGDKVEFVNCTDRIPFKYYTSANNIPSDKIRHGSTNFGKGYKREKARVEGFHDGYILVSYIDINNTNVCLGFLPESIRKVEEKSEEEKVAVAVPTQKEWNRLVGLYECKGWKSFTGKPLKDEGEWDHYKEETCIDFGDKCAWGARKNFESQGYTIISADEARINCYIPTCVNHEVSPSCPNPGTYTDSVDAQVVLDEEALEEARRLMWEMSQSHVFHNPKNIMSKITKFVKDLKLSQKDRLLRKHGLQDECGQPTEDYREILRLKQEEEGYDYVVSVAQQMEDEANKEKKKK